MLDLLAMLDPHGPEVSLGARTSISLILIEFQTTTTANYLTRAHLFLPQLMMASCIGLPVVLSLTSRPAPAVLEYSHRQNADL